jgi:C4-type Zn-finger protein
VRAGALAAGDLLRLDLHPADLDHPRHIGAVEGVLQRAHRRVRHAVTYDDLAL